MIIPRAKFARSCSGPTGLRAHSTMAFAAIGDHSRLPARFFARLFASDGALAGLYGPSSD